jgi:peptide chain release factor 3
VENADPMKTKQLNKGVDQLMDEGVAQLFTMEMNGKKIIGTVGPLQFEVIEYRLKHEYSASVRFEPVQVHKAVWVECADKKVLEEFKKFKYRNLAHDKHGRLVFLADSAFALQMTQEKFPQIKFHFKSEF